MSSWQGGKGSKPRPISDRKKFDDNWEAIFGKKKKGESKTTEEVKNGNSSN